jgi:hypothetical protein
MDRMVEEPVAVALANSSSSSRSLTRSETYVRISDLLEIFHVNWVHGVDKMCKIF